MDSLDAILCIKVASSMNNHQSSGRECILLGEITCLERVTLIPCTHGRSTTPMYKSFDKKALIAFAAVLTAASTTQAAELLSNGDFETGDLTGWTVADQAGGSGSTYNNTGTSTPISFLVTVGASGGNYYAVTDQGGPGAHALLQSFTVAAGASTQLSFDMFANDQSGFGPIINPAGLDYTASPNQHARVDILDGAAGPFDTGAGVLANFYLGVDAGPNPHAYTPYSFDISSVVAAGGTFQIRFAEVDNQLFFNLGVDNVSITSDSTVPDGGATAASLAFGLACLVPCRRFLRR